MMGVVKEAWTLCYQWFDMVMVQIPLKFQLHPIFISGELESAEGGESRWLCAIENGTRRKGDLA
jgi:hypothetical protein